MASNFPNLKKEMDIQIQESQKIPSKMNPKNLLPIHIIIKMLKAKYKKDYLKSSKRKQLITYKGTPVTIPADFSTETSWPEGSAWNLMERKNLQAKLLYPARLSFRIEEERKNFPDKQKLKQFITSKLTLQKILKEIL